jgi:hypothetical protein
MQQQWTYRWSRNKARMFSNACSLAYGLVNTAAVKHCCREWPVKRQALDLNHASAYVVKALFPRFLSL